MDKIKIKIDGRVAEIESAPEVVTDNTEYEVEFAVDERDGWNLSVPMTALFVRRDARYTAVVMDAGETICTMPPQTGTNIVYVGLTQDDMRTTTPAAIKVQRSIRTVANDPLPAPTEDVYAQILAAYAGIKILSGKGAPTSATQGEVNQLYRDESTDKLYICTGAEGGYTWAAVVSDTEDAVTYTAQTLTDEQKTQARANIGAGTSNFSGLYNDLPDKPNIPAATVIDTTLTKSGQAADAKAAGDAIGKKIDAPQTAAVGEVLTVEEVGEDGKPKKWKTQAMDVADVVKFTEQDLIYEQAEQARKNIRAKPIDFPVTITSTTTDGVTTYTADKTFAEIKAAYDSGANVYALYNEYISYLFYFGNSAVWFRGFDAYTDYIAIYINSYNGIDTIEVEQLKYLPVVSFETLRDYLNKSSPPIIMSLSDSTAPNGGGVLFYSSGMSSSKINYSLLTNSGELYNIEYDRRYGNISTSKVISPIPSPTTAQVGQIIKVKSVDESGKITETETVDMNTSVTITYNEETGNLQIGD